MRFHRERHVVERVGWLRAAVLGANDGIVSTASLVIGVAAASATKADMLVAAVAALAAGAMSMAAGEYVSVSSQADSEKADVRRERAELRDQPEAELQELTDIYVQRGLTAALARDVAVQLTAHDALAAHARDELGISALSAARPVQAALASAASFAVGAVVPVVAVMLAPLGGAIPVVAATSLASLVALGWLSARIGGVAPLRPVLRVSFWGALAMAVTAGVGALFGVAA